MIISTEIRSSQMNRVFLDTSYAVALATPRDRHHPQAVELAEHLERREARLVTTRAILLEIGNSLSKARFRSRGSALLESLETDPRVEIVPISEDLYWRGFELFRRRPGRLPVLRGHAGP